MLALGESNKQLNVLGWIMDVIQMRIYAAVTGHE